MISASWRNCIQPMIFCTMSDSFGRFDHQRQLHGRLTQLDGRPGIRILRAVDHQRPVHEVRQIRRVKAKALAGHVANKRRARLVAGVVELAPAGIAAKVLRVFRA